MSATKEIIVTDRAPSAIGPYSQAVRAGNLIFASGQIPIDPATGQFVPGGVAEQTEQVLKNLTELFAAAGVGLNQVVKTTVFLADMDDFAAMNEVYGRFFASCLALPQYRPHVCRGMRESIEAIAVRIVSGTHALACFRERRHA
jgi:2-iminobutanoate/2-iminopropanoate deaminase